MLGVVGAQPAQRRAQRGDVEGVDAGVDLADRALLRGGVGLLDDRDDLAVLGAQDAAVPGRVGQRRGQHGDGGGLGAVAWRSASARVSASSSGMSPEVTTTTPSKSSGSADSPHSDGVAGAELLRPARRPRSCGPGARRAPRPPGRCGRGPCRATTTRCCGATLATACSACASMLRPAERVQHLGGVGAHPGARACRQHHDGRSALSCGHLDYRVRSASLVVARPSLAPSPGLEPELSEPKSEVLPITPRRTGSTVRLTTLVQGQGYAGSRWQHRRRSRAHRAPG